MTGDRVAHTVQSKKLLTNTQTLMHTNSAAAQAQ